MIEVLAKIVGIIFVLSILVLIYFLWKAIMNDGDATGKSKK